MSEPRACSRCGAALAPAIEGPICPACLIEAALAESDLSGTETFVRDGSPTGQTTRTPDRVGAFKILAPLGEGGMGVVYLAEQAAPIRRRVALKLIKLGMDTRKVVARFDAERQALALMDHPNIASVFDAGATDDGRPYFVMEYVPGVPITEFSDRHQLSTRARLELFQQVCAAVQHAHQKGIIHRDLKPSNVLVMEQDGRPVPKVIDFGIAKATDQHVTEKTLFTEHGLFVGTPEYMSPEQADTTVGDVDTRADIYSLGMVLYELLVGGLPFSRAELRHAGYAEIQRIIREEEPPKPSTKVSSLGVTASEVASRRRTNLSTLVRDLRGDLDWITLKSIEKDRSRRYASASELAADIGRHLHHEPVAAGPPNASYRLRKFVRKHRGAVAAWAALLLLLTAGLVVSATLYVRAERSRQDADRQRTAADLQRDEAARQRVVADVQSQDADRQRQAAQTERAAAEAQRNAAETERDKALYQNYRSALLATDLSLQAGEVAQARQQLQAAEPRLRGWEWRYLARMADSSNAATSVFSNEVREVRFSRNGNAVLARGYEWFWGPGRGVQVAPARARELSVTRVTPGNLASPSRLDLGERLVAISPDGTRVLSAGWTADDYSTVCERRDSSGAAVCQPGSFGRRGPLSAEQRDRLIVRDTTTGKDVATLTHPNLGVWTTAQSPAGQLTTGVTITIRHGEGPLQQLLSANTVRVAGSPQPLATLSGWYPEVAGAAFSADGLRVATWSWDNLIYVWDVASQSILTTLRGHRDGIRSVCFNATANQLVSASFDGTIRLWAVPGGTQLQELPMPGPSTVTYAPNDANIAVGTDSGVIQILDGSAGRIVRALPGHTSSVISLAFSPDSTRLASAAWDDRTARLWDVSTGAQLLLFSGHEKGVMSVAFRPDGDVVASGSSDGTVRFWNARAARSLLTGHTRTVTALNVANPGGAVMSMSTDGTVRVWDAVSGRSDRLDLNRVERPFRPPYFGLTMRPPRVAVPSPEAATVSGGSTKVLDIPSGKTVMEVTHETLAQVAISPDGARLAIATRTGSGGVIRMWRIPSGRLTATWTLASAWPLGAAIAFDRDSRRIAVSADARSPSDPRTMRGQILILDESSPTPVDSFFVPFLPGPAVFLPDGSGVLYVDGPRTHVWDFRRRAEVAVLSHPKSCYVTAVTPDGSRVLTGCSDATLRVWDAARRQLLLTIRLSSEVTAVAVSPDGSRIAAGLANGQIQILDAGVVRDIVKRHP